jgi:hypothetical protein
LLILLKMPALIQIVCFGFKTACMELISRWYAPVKQIGCISIYQLLCRSYDQFITEFNSSCEPISE